MRTGGRVETHPVQRPGASMATPVHWSAPVTAPVDISVVVPTCRRPGPLAEALASVMSQDARLEVLVLDDDPEGSARTTVEALRDRRLTYRRREVPSGGNPALVRNEGWPDTRGPILQFLDDDDRVSPGAYRAVLSAFGARPDVGVVFGRIEPFGEDPAVLSYERDGFSRGARRARLYQRLGSRLLVVANELYSMPTLFVNSSCFVRRRVVEEIGGYDPDLRVAEDIDFYLRAVRASGFVYLDRSLIQYRTGAPSIMHDLPDGRPLALAYGRIYHKYRARHGPLELYGLKILAKALLRWL